MGARGIPFLVVFFFTKCQARNEACKHFSQISAQRTVGVLRPGYQGLWTPYPRGNKQIPKEHTLSFKMIPRTACHPGGAANLKIFGFGH